MIWARRRRQRDKPTPGAEPAAVVSALADSAGTTLTHGEALGRLVDQLLVV